MQGAIDEGVQTRVPASLTGQKSPTKLSKVFKEAQSQETGSNDNENEVQEEGEIIEAILMLRTMYEKAMTESKIQWLKEKMGGSSTKVGEIVSGSDKLPEEGRVEAEVKTKGVVVDWGE
ncbi:hypothetical protein U1Q18_040923, partial [Sarracenia purpurea var. burkii]